MIEKTFGRINNICITGHRKALNAGINNAINDAIQLHQTYVESRLWHSSDKLHFNADT